MVMVNAVLGNNAFNCTYFEYFGNQSVLFSLRLSEFFFSMYFRYKLMVSFGDR